MPRGEGRARPDRTEPVNHFLALAPDEDARDELAMLADRLRAWRMPARWTHPDDYHLTLVFLGRLDEAAAADLPGLLAEVAGSLRRPELRLAGLGACAGRTEPRTVFAAVEDADAACDAMRRDLCEVLGLRPGPGFRPHITLCRPQPAEPGQPLPLFRDWPHLLEAHGMLAPRPCGVGELALYRSSGRGETRYEALASWRLHD